MLKDSVGKVELWTRIWRKLGLAIWHRPSREVYLSQGSTDTNFGGRNGGKLILLNMEKIASNFAKIQGLGTGFFWKILKKSWKIQERCVKSPGKSKI